MYVKKKVGFMQRIRGIFNKEKQNADLNNVSFIRNDDLNTSISATPRSKDQSQLDYF